MSVIRILMIETWSHLAMMTLFLLLLGWFSSLFSAQQQMTIWGYILFAILSIFVWWRVRTIQFIVKNGTVFPGEIVGARGYRHSRLYTFTYTDASKKKSSGHSRLNVVKRFEKNDKIKVIWHKRYPDMPLILDAYKK